MVELRAVARQHTRTTGEDMPLVRDWSWTG
jgi:hypothetical protein